jgi:hypothetical protein
MASIASWLVVAALTLGSVLGRRWAQARRSGYVWFIGFLSGSVLLVVWLLLAGIPTRIAFRIGQPSFDRLVTQLSTPGRSIRPPFRAGLFELESGPWYFNRDGYWCFSVCGDELKSKRFFVHVPQDSVEQILQNPWPYGGRWRRLSEHWFVWRKPD